MLKRPRSLHCGDGAGGARPSRTPDPEGSSVGVSSLAPCLSHQALHSGPCHWLCELAPNTQKRPPRHTRSVCENHTHPREGHVTCTREERPPPKLPDTQGLLWFRPSAPRLHVRVEGNSLREKPEWDGAEPGVRHADSRPVCFTVGCTRTPQACTHEHHGLHRHTHAQTCLPAFVLNHDRGPSCTEKPHWVTRGPAEGGLTQEGDGDMSHCDASVCAGIQLRARVLEVVGTGGGKCNLAAAVRETEAQSHTKPLPACQAEPLPGEPPCCPQSSCGMGVQPS